MSTASCGDCAINIQQQQEEGDDKGVLSLELNRQLFPLGFYLARSGSWALYTLVFMVHGQCESAGMRPSTGNHAKRQPLKRRDDESKCATDVHSEKHEVDIYP